MIAPAGLANQPSAKTGPGQFEYCESSIFLNAVTHTLSMTLCSMCLGINHASTASETLLRQDDCGQQMKVHRWNAKLFRCEPANDQCVDDEREDSCTAWVTAVSTDVSRRSVLWDGREVKISACRLCPPSLGRFGSRAEFGNDKNRGIITHAVSKCSPRRCMTSRG